MSEKGRQFHEEYELLPASSALMYRKGAKLVIEAFENLGYMELRLEGVGGTVGYRLRIHREDLDPALLTQVPGDVWQALKVLLPDEAVSHLNEDTGGD